MKERLDFEDICDCVIAPTTRQEDQVLRRYEERGLTDQGFIRRIFTDGRDLSPDADCPKCNGTGEATQ
jgi:hypothetical protein